MRNKKADYDISELAAKWQNGSITPEERAFYENWYAGFDDTQTTIEDRFERSSQQIEKRIYKRLYISIWGTVDKRFTVFWRSAAAVVILVTMSIAAYYYLTRLSQPFQHAVAETRNAEIVPGSNKAVLILDDGRQIDLSDVNDGTIAGQNNVQIRKTPNGKIIYSMVSSTPNDIIAYNTIKVPKGGQYEIVLSDGSSVLLNASSSLRFPTVFNAKNRTVELNGEAYFTVVHNVRQPFQVKSKGQLVEDVGTQFNIRAYNDESGIKTSLLEGRVKVSLGKQTILMKPGQQTLADATALRLEKNIDVDAATAWKNGNFQFDNLDIDEIMRQIARWYDVDVQYQQGDIKGERFSGIVPRSANLASVLNIMQSTGAIHFQIKQRRIIVMP